MITVIRAKFHGIRVTQADLHYHGSITLDPELCDAVGMLPLEFVEIWNRTNGQRFSTYVIFGEPGSSCCIVNGAAARLVQSGDEIIIAAKAQLNEPQQLYTLTPRVLTFGEGNTVTGRYRYEVFPNTARAYNFRMIDETSGHAMPVPMSDLLASS
jgi:aspartate 1-decarboxylase